jgi:sulfur carrier protein ThiS
MAEINVDTWLYGKLARYGGSANQGSFANLLVALPEGSKLEDLLAHLQLPTEERGITFINGELSAMPRSQPDLAHTLQNGDRVAFFDPLSMWPFQYRSGVPMIAEMADSMRNRDDKGLHHSYRRE